MAAARTRNTATVKRLQRRCSRYDGCKEPFCTRAARIQVTEFEGGRRSMVLPERNPRRQLMALCAFLLPVAPVVRQHIEAAPSAPQRLCSNAN